MYMCGGLYHSDSCSDALDKKALTHSPPFYRKNNISQIRTLGEEGDSKGERGRKVTGRGRVTSPEE